MSLVLVGRKEQEEQQLGGKFRYMKQFDVGQRGVDVTRALCLHVTLVRTIVSMQI